MEGPDPTIDRRTIVKAVGAGSVIFVAGCAENDIEEDPDDEPPDDDPPDDDDNDEPDEDGQRISWHAGGTGGTYFPLSGEFKTIVDAETPHTLEVQSTGASVENVGSLANESADFALIQNDIAFFAKNGTGLEEFEGNPIENLMGVATLYPETIHIIVRPEADIETLEDMADSDVNTGDLGSGTQVNALQILESAGVSQDDFREQNASFSVAADQIRDGDVDAAFVVGGWPVGAVEELAQTTDIELLELSGDALEDTLAAAEWFAEDTIPGGTYEGIDEDVTTVSVQAMIASHEAYPEDVVEDVTAAIFDNADQLTIKSDFINVETAQDAMPIELHPGATAYFGGEVEDEENGEDEEDGEDEENGEDEEDGEDEENGEDEEDGEDEEG